MFYSKRGFTLIEVFVVGAIFMVLTAVVVAGWVVIQKKSILDAAANEFAAIIKVAQNKTVNSEQEAQYGVYLNISGSPHKYILFKGIDYASREASFDRIYPLPVTAEFFAISLASEKSNQIIFSKVTGQTAQYGSVGVRLKADTSQSKTLYVAGNGVIGFDAPTSIQDTRFKDSRHVHIDYSQTINTSSENVVLNFNDSEKIVTIPIFVNIGPDGQFSWEKTTEVGGKNQTIKIHTHSLNNSGTQFSVHRDLRLNTKSLKISLSGDSSGTLAEYSADGLTTNFTSSYVTSLTWQ